MTLEEIGNLAEAEELARMRWHNLAMANRADDPRQAADYRMAESRYLRAMAEREAAQREYTKVVKDD